MYPREKGVWNLEQFTKEPAFWIKGNREGIAEKSIVTYRLSICIPRYIFSLLRKAEL